MASEDGDNEPPPEGPEPRPHSRNRRPSHVEPTWVKWRCRDWRESERVRLLPLAARALYFDMLMLQPISGSIPSDPRKVALLIHADASEVSLMLPLVLPMFEQRTIDSEQRLVNEGMERACGAYISVSKANARGGRASGKSRGQRPKRANERSTNVQRTFNDTSRLASAERERTLNDTSHFPSTSTSLSVSVSKAVASRVKSLDSRVKGLDPGFTRFWEAYPKRKSRGQAEATWAKIAPDAALVQQIVAGAKRLANDPDACRERGKFVPHPSTWLNAKGWLDEPTRLPHALDEPEDYYKNFDDMYPEAKA